MSEPRSSRRKNIGFKQEGLDQAHDTVYSVLESLPRGGVSDLVVKAVMEFLKNHAGETIQGTRSRKYIILGEKQPVSIQGKLPQKSCPSIVPEKRGNKDILSEPNTAPTSKDEITASEESAGRVASNDLEPFSETATPLYSELDDETLSGLVMGFLGDK